MSDQKVMVFTPEGKVAGYFLGPEVHMPLPCHYTIKGQFYDPEGELNHRIQFNPQVMPYTVDMSSISKCNHNKLVKTYIERGRQPVEMAGVCNSADV